MDPISDRLQKEAPDENILSKLISGIFGKRKTTLFFDKDKPPRTETIKLQPNIIDQAKALPEFISQRLGREQEFLSPIPENAPSLPVQETPFVETPEAPQIPQEVREVERAPATPDVSQAINVFGGEDAPLHKYSHVIEEAIGKYPLFKNNPYLIPVVSHLETSSGRNITRPNNLINYGIRSEKINELFGKVGIEDALRRSLKEIGSTGTVYKKFDTGKPLTDEEILEFAKTYEPANPDYPENLLNGIRHVEQTVQ